MNCIVKMFVSQETFHGYVAQVLWTKRLLCHPINSVKALEGAKKLTPTWENRPLTSFFLCPPPDSQGNGRFCIYHHLWLSSATWLLNKTQSETADFAAGAATWRTGQIIFVLFDSGLFGPLCESMTLEVHIALHCHRRRTEQQPQVTCETDRHTHRHADHNTWHFYQGEVVNIWPLETSPADSRKVTLDVVVIHVYWIYIRYSCILCVEMWFQTTMPSPLPAKQPLPRCLLRWRTRTWFCSRGHRD